MPITPGTRLGPYEIVAPIGAGGMGEVYRAKDIKLGREVALKVLPLILAGNADYMARFEREAKVLASLNHPHIATIHGLEENAIVMELVEGTTLAERIAKGPVPLEQSLNMARQIAEALEYAHERSVIHRDLKPANVKITPEGVVKVLDFGLAKVMESPVESHGHAVSSATLTLHATAMGTIMGTAAYMSPEQARASPVDRRADIWAFGVVLFEMLSAKMAFEGESVTDILAAVVRGEPNWKAMPSSTPAVVRKLIDRCLTKDRKQRLQAIGEARIAIDEYFAAPTQPEAPSERRRPWLNLVLAAALAASLIVAGAGWWKATRLPPLQPLVRLSLEIPSDTPLARSGDGGGMLDLSPDGSRLVLTMRGADGKVSLHTRLLNQSRFTPLAGTVDAYNPFFSPDGNWIGFFADGKLKKIPFGGGDAFTLCDAPRGRGASWGDDGNIIAALQVNGILSLVPSGGGTPLPVTKFLRGERTHRFPQVLPGSKMVLFTSSQKGGDMNGATIELLSLRTGERKTIHSKGFYPRYARAPSGAGYLIYLNQSTLLSAPFDLGRQSLTGTPVPVLEDASSNQTTGANFAFSEIGTLVYLSGKRQQTGAPISWLDSSGKTQPLYVQPGIYNEMRFSPNGKRLAFTRSTGSHSDIWVKDLDRETPLRLTFLPGENGSPVWTPDGATIIFRSTDHANPGMYWISSDGSGEPHRITDGILEQWPSSFSPDGKRLAFSLTGNAGRPNLYTAPVEQDAEGLRLGKAELFQATAAGDQAAMFSPDGRWLAYFSEQSGSAEIYGSAVSWTRRVTADLERWRFTPCLVSRRARAAVQ